MSILNNYKQYGHTHLILKNIYKLKTYYYTRKQINNLKEADKNIENVNESEKILFMQKRRESGEILISHA